MKNVGRLEINFNHDDGEDEIQENKVVGVRVMYKKLRDETTRGKIDFELVHSFGKN